MKPISTAFTKRLIIGSLIACWQLPAFGGTTDISNIPLATSSGAGILPNLLFTLDNSGSMASDFLPDYADGSTLPSTTCPNTSSGNNNCALGDPGYMAGGQHAMNGVAYDPNNNYLPALTSTGATLLTAPLSTTALAIDAYGIQSTGTINITSGIRDHQFCNSAATPVCKLNGATLSAGVYAALSGTDGLGHTMSAGQFAYRTNPSNSSKAIFGLPEMMSIGTFSRSGTTVTVTTTAPHGLTTGNTVFVTGVSTSSVNTNAAVVTVTNANTFTYTSGTSGTVSARTGSFRAHSSGTWAIASGTVTVTSNNHGLQVNDIIFANPGTSATQFSQATFTVTAVTTNTFSYASTTGVGTPTGTWVRTGLYNVSSNLSGPAISYYITPVEYCADTALTNCVEVIPPAAPPAGFPNPAYVRFCQTQDQALAPGAVGDTTGTPRCRSKYVNSTGLPQYTFLRYGWFTRDTITTATAAGASITFGNRPNRNDCAAAPVCTYTEEIQNYARWYTYYRTRMQMMKTAVGRSFITFVGNPGASPARPNSLRVGFITIHAEDSGSIDTNQYLKINDFNTTQASSFYTIFYKQNPNNDTPLPDALARAGWIFSGKLNTGLTNGISNNDDPMQASCQRNFSLMTTDGYWNVDNPKTLGNTAIGNLDDVDPTFFPLVGGQPLYSQPVVDRATTGTFDGGGSTVTTSTPTSQTLQQVLCSATGNASFSDGNSTPCGCTTGQHSVIQETSILSTTSTSTEGQAPVTGTGTTVSYQVIAACNSHVVVTTLTPVNQTEDHLCKKSSNSVTFASGATRTCSCTSSNPNVILRQTISGETQTTTVTDGASSSSNTGGTTAYSYSTNGTTFTTFTGTNASPGTCGSSSLSVTLSPNPKIDTSSATSTVNDNGGTTVSSANITLSPNPQTRPPSSTATFTTVTPGGTANTLADTALYYFETDLRGGVDPYGNATGPSTTLGGTGTTDVSANNVPAKTGALDFETSQHMVTFTVGMSDGLMQYQSDYPTATTGDFANIKNRALGACFWTSGYCDWPAPVSNTASALDDLWHAAVNGRGTFYQALNSNALAQGLSGALTALNAQVAAAAASATSSPNVTQTNNQIFSTTYETTTWSGKVFAQTIDPTTGLVNPAIQWQADVQLAALAGPSSDSRNIWTFDTGSSTTKVKAFTWANMTSTQEQNWFQNRCSPLTTMTQCATLSTADLATANSGASMVGFLRGWSGSEASPGCTSCAFRDRQVIDPLTNVASQTVLGDTITATPSFVSNPTFSYTDTVAQTYATFATNNASRAPRVYVGANDGYLHAFDGATGAEAWAYAPRFLLSATYQLADTGYATQHRYFVDGSPQTGDVFDTTAGVWKTILVGGASGGGRGFYALDITDPTAPKALWEFCSDSTVCALNDADLGYSYGNPIIGKRSFDGRWVVILTSGLNNVSSGSGVGFFYVVDAITGALLNKVSTGVGNTSTPSGLMKTAAFFESALTDATFQYVYGGDQLGNVWRLDVSTSTPTVMHVATLEDATGRVQPITTRPLLTHIILGSTETRIVFVGTGRYLGSSDLTDPGAASGIAYQQSFYAIKDKNADYGSGNFRTLANLLVQTLTLISPGNRGISNNVMDWNVRDGWMIDFNPAADPSPGERVNIDPRLVLGTLVIITNVPTAAGSCSVGGTSEVYSLDFNSGSYLPTSAGGVAGRSLGGTIAVGMAIVQLPSGAIKDIVTGADTSKSTLDVQFNSTAAGVKRFSYRER
jgi:Tfp pilus tip-associated adhesin PilY1